MRRPGTLRGRLSLLALLTTATWVALLTAGFNVVLSQRLDDEARAVLRARAAAVAETVEVATAKTIEVTDPRGDSALDADIWVYRGNVALERPSDSAALQAAADALAGSPEHFSRVDGPFPVRMYTLPIVSGGTRLGTVVAAVGLSPYWHTARLALYGSLGLALFLLIGVYLVTRLVVSRALQPVHDMSRQAARWSADDVGRRFGQEARPGELAALAANLDGLLDRLSAVLRYETQLTAELSHELRTPLSRITAETDLLRSRPRDPAELDRAYAEISASTEQMSQILETLLSAARTAGGAPPGRCAAGPVLEALATRVLGPVLGLAGIRLHNSAPSVTAGVEAAILDRIVTPVLDNAARYAVSRVDIGVALVDGAVRIEVTDDGPGVPAGLGEAVFEPGRRAHPSDGHDGAGLGLPLARRLARAAGGEITMAPGQASTFVVRLPAG